jgi:hypothetical protein
VSVPPVRAWIELVGRWHDRRAGGEAMCGDRELASELLGIQLRGRLGDGDAGDDRERLQVDEDVPRIAQEDRLQAVKALVASDGNCGRDGFVRASGHEAEGRHARR